jgi:hypothetical protein
MGYSSIALLFWSNSQGNSWVPMELAAASRRTAFLARSTRLEMLQLVSMCHRKQ